MKKYLLSIILLTTIFLASSVQAQTTGLKNGTTGSWVGFIPNISSGGYLSWFNPINIYKGFVGELAIDPRYPNNAWHMGSQGPSKTQKFDKSGNQTEDRTLKVTGSGEKISFAIAPNGENPGVWHAMTGGYFKDWSNYSNSTINRKEVWSSNDVYDGGDDGAYVEIGVDIKDPNVAYLVGPYGGTNGYNGVAINIWDGEKFLFPKTALYIVDKNAAAYGNGVRRYSPQWTTAEGGGAFLCWTSADGNVKLKYITHEGEDKFGPTVNIGVGSQCTVSTDTLGNIDIAYITNGIVKYRKVVTTVAP